MKDIAHEIVRSLPARNLAIVNGHGGNRGVLENLIRELRGDCGLNACVIHPFDLSKAEMGSGYPDVHGGKGETSVMLALAPQLVRRDEIGRPSNRRTARQASRRWCSIAERPGPGAATIRGLPSAA